MDVYFPDVGENVYICPILAPEIPFPKGTHTNICQLQMETNERKKLTSSVLESAAEQSEMEVVVRCKNDVIVCVSTLS